MDFSKTIILSCSTICAVIVCNASGQVVPEVRSAHESDIDSRIEHIYSVYDAVAVNPWGMVATSENRKYVTWYDIYGNITDRVAFEYSHYFGPPECGVFPFPGECGPSGGSFAFNTIEQTSDFGYITTSPSPQTECDSFVDGDYPHQVCLFKIDAAHGLEWMKVYYGDGIASFPCMLECFSGPVARQVRDVLEETAGFLLVTSRYGRLDLQESETYRGVVVFTDSAGLPIFQAEYSDPERDLILTDGCQVEDGFMISGVVFSRDVFGCVDEASPIFLHIDFDGTILHSADYGPALDIVMPGVDVFSVGCVAVDEDSVAASWSLGNYCDLSSKFAAVCVDLDCSIDWASFDDDEADVLPPGLVAVDCQMYNNQSLIAIGGPCNESMGHGYIAYLDATTGAMVSRSTILANTLGVVPLSVDTVGRRFDPDGPGGWLLGGGVFDGTWTPPLFELVGTEHSSLQNACDVSDTPELTTLDIEPTQWTPVLRYAEGVNCYAPYVVKPPLGVQRILCEDN